MSAKAKGRKALHRCCWKSDLRFKETDGNLVES